MSRCQCARKHGQNETKQNEKKKIRNSSRLDTTRLQSHRMHQFSALLQTTTICRYMLFISFHPFTKQNRKVFGELDRHIK